jgi:hypothetical protein
LKCSAGNHLWRHGLALAIYNKAGALTNNGEVPRTFFAKRETLAKFFDASYNAVCNAVKYLRDEKWLLPTEKENHFLYARHDDWAAKNPGKCMARDLVPYQEEADPFVGKLFAIARGSLKVKEHWIIGMRKNATDEEILDLFAKQREIDIARRKSGDGHLTAPNNSLYVVMHKLKVRRK